MGNTLWFEAHPPPLDEILAHAAQRLHPMLDRWGVRLAEPVEQVHLEIWQAYETAARIERERGTHVDPSIPFLTCGAMAVRGIDITEEQAEEWWRTAYLPVRMFNWQLYPDSLDVLREVRAMGMRVGVNTNRPFTTEMFTPDLEDYGVARLVDAVVCSGDTGYYKPHPSTFERVLAALGVAAGEALMVGDDCASDMVGAKALGMGTVWKLNGRYDASPCAAADFAIHDLGELVALPPLERGPQPLATTESLTPHEDANADRY
jgi:HAD superfamily hydrolase (TIGR01509 family)